MRLSTLKPAVPKYWLIAIAGLVWSTVGVMLCRLAYQWLTVLYWVRAVSFGVIGVVLAVIANIFLFSGIARKNIDRISHYLDKGCVFAFQAWKSYLIIILMITLGIFMRRSALPRDYLAVLYAGMGGALFLSSFRYYIYLWQAAANNPQGPPPQTVQERHTETDGV